MNVGSRYQMIKIAELHMMPNSAVENKETKRLAAKEVIDILHEMSILLVRQSPFPTCNLQHASRMLSILLSMVFKLTMAHYIHRTVI